MTSLFENDELLFAYGFLRNLGMIHNALLRLDNNNLFKKWRIKIIRDDPFSTYTKSPEKLTLLTSWYAHVRAYQGGKK